LICQGRFRRGARQVSTSQQNLLSAVFVLLTFLLLFTAQEEKFPHKFLLKRFLFRRFKMAEEKKYKFGSFDL